MSPEKQKLFIEFLLSSKEVYNRTRSIVKYEYFVPEYKKVIKYIQDYESKYGNIPTIKQIHAETLKEFDNIPSNLITNDQKDSVCDEIERFCKNKAIELAAHKFLPLLDELNYGEIEKLMKEALSVSLVKDLGVNYFENPLERMNASRERLTRYSTGWKTLDGLMNGGPAKTEMMIFTANAGGGKSILLSNLAKNFVDSGRNVLYLSGELSETLIAQRFDIIYTGIPSVIWETKIAEIADTLIKAGKHSGSLQIKKLKHGDTAMEIRAYLNEYFLVNEYVPDLLIIDHLDHISPSKKVSMDNLYIKDEAVTNELYALGSEFNLILATATWQNRSAIDATKVNQSHISGGISKTNITDWQFSIKLTQNMKVEGHIELTCTKSRSSDAEGKSEMMKWDNRYLRISDLNDSEQDYLKNILDRKKGTITPENDLTSGGLLSMMDFED